MSLAQDSQHGQAALTGCTVSLATMAGCFDDSGALVEKFVVALGVAVVSGFGYQVGRIGFLWARKRFGLFNGAGE